jgi:hypothetical protein
MLIAWLVATLFSLISARIALQAGADGVLFGLMAVLLGPGAIPLTRTATQRPPDATLAPLLATIGVVGGFLSTLFVLCNSCFWFYVWLFERMSLALPLPTQIVCALVHLLSTSAGGFFIAILAFWLPNAGYQLLERRVALEAKAEALRALRAWSYFLPCLASVVVLLTSIAFALLQPYWMLSEPIGG